MKPLKFTIITPKPDYAGPNIAQELENLGLEYLETEERSIYLENIDKTLETDFIIFATTHRGKTEKMLSVHAPGNWKKAELGGMQGKLCPTSARVLKIFFQELNKNIPPGWQATLECTHHGPYLETPCLFIEIGSNETNWQDKEAGLAIANTIKQAISRVNSSDTRYKTAIAIGGPHYCPNFNKIQLNSQYAISHIIPEYALPLEESMLDEAINKTQEKIDSVLIDWKGLGKSEQKQKILSLLNQKGLSVLRTSEVEK
jgi:D-aminoacyl-tRNA deacylase